MYLSKSSFPSIDILLRRELSGGIHKHRQRYPIVSSGFKTLIGTNILNGAAFSCNQGTPSQPRSPYSQSASAPTQLGDHTILPAAYVAPTTGILSLLPSSWIPYAELVRLDKPAGTYYLFFPCLFSTLMAASYASSPTLPMVKTSILFFVGALIMRGAGCSINDFWDRNLDPHVARTRLRPIARGAISPQNAINFTGAPTPWQNE